MNLKIYFLSKGRRDDLFRDTFFMLHKIDDFQIYKILETLKKFQVWSFYSHTKTFKYYKTNDTAK